MTLIQAEAASFATWQQDELLRQRCMDRALRWVVKYGLSNFRHFQHLAGDLFSFRESQNSFERCELCGHRQHEGTASNFPGCACPY